MVWEINDKSTYILRYYLPLDPTYDETIFNKRGDELIQYCLNNHITAVMLYVDLNPNWYYSPDSLEHTRYYATLLQPVIEKLRENAISYQLNYQNLVGAWDGGANLNDVNQWENWVDQDGKASSGCACCLGSRFRAVAGQKLKLWAATKPDVIWIDDDVRFHNHLTAIGDLWSGKSSSYRVDYGCFCDEHIKKFNETYHLSYSRAKIVEGILSGGDGRKRWMNFSGSVADEFASWIEKTIHEISPNTRIAVMTSTVDSHSVEGRNWNSFLHSLSGEHKPLLRPTFGPYKEGDPRAFFISYLAVEQLKENIKSQYGRNVDFCPEIENTRFTCWSKSIAATKYQLFLSAFLGCRCITLSIFDLEGCVLEEEPEFAKMLIEMKPVLDVLSQYDLWQWGSEGIGFITSPDRIKDSEKSVSSINELAEGRIWEHMLIKAGIPCKYVVPDAITEVNSVALDAYTVNLLTDEDLKYLLSKGVLLDAAAAEILANRGFSEYLGVQVGEKMKCVANCEVLEQFSRTDGSKVRIPARIDGYKWNNLILNGADRISTLITPLGSEHVGFSKYVNKLGGKVYVYAANGSFGDGFYTTYRVKMLKNICNDMAGAKLVEVDNSSYSLVASKKDKSERVVMVTNMNADTMDDICIRVPEDVKEAVFITQNGDQRETVINGNVISCSNASLKLYEGIVCLMKTVDGEAK